MKTKKLLFTTIIFYGLIFTINAQNVGINSTGVAPNASALLDIDAAPGNNKGLLIPRIALLSTTDVVTIPTPATSLLVYNSNAAMTGGALGYWYWNGTNWVQLGASTGGNDWALIGNSGTVDGTNFIGTTDNIPFNIRVNNQKAGRIDPTLNNAFFGYKAGNSNTTGIHNIAFGTEALSINTTGAFNCAFGSFALSNNISGHNNVAIGLATLLSNTTGLNNVAVGNGSLRLNTTGNNNTVVGKEALPDNVGGMTNTAIGANALFHNSWGSNNVGIGVSALSDNTFGMNNTGVGLLALGANQTGNDNASLGYHAGYSVFAPLLSYDQCTFVGSSSAITVTRTNVTMLGYGIANAQCTANNQVLLGNTAVTQIRAAITGITAYSDARFKINVKENVEGLDFILKLKPVTYNVRPKKLHQIWGTPDSLVNQLDFNEAENETRIGFLAQDVEQAAKESGFNFPGIDIPKNNKEVYALRYVDFIMPLVKAVQEQQKIIENQQKEIDKLKKLMEQLLEK